MSRMRTSPASRITYPRTYPASNARMHSRTAAPRSETVSDSPSAEIPSGTAPANARTRKAISAARTATNTGSLTGRMAWVTPRTLYPAMTAAAITAMPMHIDVASVHSPPIYSYPMLRML